MRAASTTLMLIHAVLFVATTARGQAIPVLSSPELSFSRPQTAAAGLVTVCVRTHATDAGGGGSWSDVVLLDLRADCTSDLVRELTTDGVSSQPSITDDANQVLYVRESGPSSWEVRRLDLATEMDLLLATETQVVSGLDVSRDGLSAAYLVGPVGARDLIFLDVSGGLPVRTVAASGDLQLAIERPISAGPTIHYSARIGSHGQLFAWAPGVGSTQLTSATEDHGPPSASEAGNLAFIRTTDSGIANLWAWMGGSSVQLTFNADPSARFAEPAMGAIGSLVHFATTMDLTGGNPDGSWEVFREHPAGGPTMQLTDRTDSPPDPPEYVMRGLTSARQGARTNVFFGGSLKEVFPGGLPGQNAVAVQLVTHDHGMPAPIPVDEDLTLVAPPLDVRSDPPDFVPPLSCDLVGVNLTCQLVVRNPGDQARSSVVVGEWEITDPPGCETLVRSPLGWTSLDQAEQVVVTDTIELSAGCMNPTGTYRVRAIRPAPWQHDLAADSATFSF